MRNSPQDVHKKVLGGCGEKLAAEWYRKQGCRILERNYRTPFGEADLVLEDGDELVFAEVKTRTGDEFGAPSDAVGRAKRQRYRKIAEFRLLRETEERNVRFDVVEIENGGINVIKNAF